MTARYRGMRFTSAEVAILCAGLSLGTLVGAYAPALFRMGVLSAVFALAAGTLYFQVVSDR